ncbi:MAG TPA: AAA family ATPase, partial [Chloroflexota bacterium]
MAEQVGLLEAADRPARSAGKVVVVAGTRAGVGRTTVAVGLALALAGAEVRVALIDLDLRLGNLAPLLGIKPGGDILSALAPGVLDDLGRLRAQLAWGPSGVDVLPAPPPDDRRSVDPARVARLMSSLGELYDYVIVDTAPGVDEVNRAAFAAAARVLLVVTPELASVEIEPTLPRD